MKRTPISELKKRASGKRPASGTSQYASWWKARRLLGLSTAPKGITKNLRSYMADYAKKKRRRVKRLNQAKDKA